MVIAFRTWKHLGDYVTITACIHSAVSKYPDVKFTVDVGDAYNQFLQLYANNPYYTPCKTYDHVIHVRYDINNDQDYSIGKYGTITQGVVRSALMQLEQLLGMTGDAITAVKTSLPSIKDNPDKYRLYGFTARGMIKATPLSSFRLTSTRVGAMSLNDNDKLCFMGILSDNDNERLVYTKNGFGIILKLSLCPSTGRLTKGQKVMKITDDDESIGMCVSKGVKEVCIITKKGYGKIVELDAPIVATKKRQNMVELTRLVEGDEVLKVIPVTKTFYNSKMVFQMQSGDKTEINTSDIKIATRHAKPFKIAPVKRGDSIIRIRLNE